MLGAGCPWRDLPCPGTHWRTVYGYFTQWRESGLWARLLKGLQHQSQGRLFSVDATYIRVNHSAANPRGGQLAQAIAISRGGLTCKIHALVEGRGRAMRLLLSGGNVPDIKMASALVEGVGRHGCSVLLANKGYDADALRVQLVEAENVFPCLALSHKRLESRPFHRGYYRKRQRVENFFCSLKRFRRVATRYDKLASSFLAFVQLASILHWLRTS